MKGINKLDKIKALVGDLTKEQLQHIDCFIGDKVGVFMPISGQCYYAITPAHTIPPICLLFLLMIKLFF